MNAEDLYTDFPELLTPEEKEDFAYVKDSLAVKDCSPGFERWWRARAEAGFLPDAHDRTGFESERRPGMGMTPALIDEILAHDAQPSLAPVQKRKVFNILRSHMLRNLTPCSGCCTVPELLAVLRSEIESNTTSPVPTWYVFSDKTFGPRRIGYYHCCKTGCFQTETPVAQFAVCSGCRLARYCGKECQKEDWKKRHKIACSKGKESRDKVKQVSELLSRFAAMNR